MYSAATLLLGMEAAFAFCQCGDNLCNTLSEEGGTCSPQETSDNCPEDCGEPIPPPVQLTVRVFVVPFGDPGRFNLRAGNSTLATNVSGGGSTGPHTVPGGATLTETAGMGTDLTDYRTTICGACSGGGAIGPGTRQSCSITNLLLPTLTPAPTCSFDCFRQSLQCGAAGEEPEFCFNQRSLCLNQCRVGPAQRLTIARYAGSPGAVDFGESRADQTLARMSGVVFDGLRQFTGIPCNKAFCRGGGVRDFAVTDGIIDTKEEEEMVFDQPVDIVVVRDIPFCNELWQPDRAGCSNDIPSSDPFVVVSTATATTWAHEYGHTQGLEHRNDPDAVMCGGDPFECAGGTRDEINPRECAFYRSGFVDLPLLSEIAKAANERPKLDIHDYVRQTFPHGVPFEEASRYSRDVVPILLDMLSDSDDEEYWPNVVVVLGALGDERAVEPLIALLEASENRALNDFEYRAKRNVLMSLGYLINVSGSNKALQYLTDSVNPAIWAKREMAWYSPFGDTNEFRDQDLSRLAIIGLALSGHAAAEKTLREQLAPTSANGLSKFRRQAAGVTTEAIKAHEIIVREGLIGYYANAGPEGEP